MSTGLKFYPTSHRYRLDGAWVPGVTTLIGKGLPKPAIPYWAAKSVAEFVADNRGDVESMWDKGRGPMVAYLKETPWQKRDDAAARGTEVHDLAERVVNGESVQVPEHLADLVTGYVEWLDAFQVEPILTEQAAANRKWQYAGKFDAIVRMGNGPLAGATVLVDWKTSKGVYGETGLQTAAYARCEFYGEDGDEHPMPAIDATAVVHIQPGESTCYALSPTPEAIDQAFKVFSHIAYVANNTDYIKSLLGPQLTLTQEKSE